MPTALPTGTDRFLTEYVPHPAFDQEHAESLRASKLLEELARRAGAFEIEDILQRSPRPPSKSIEQYLFVTMNWDRYRLKHGSMHLSSSSLSESAERLTNRALAIRNWIVAANQGLVFSLARQIAGTYSIFEELAGEGWFPLIRACELFDATRQYRFSTYATHAIRNHLHRCSRRLQPSASAVIDDEDLLVQVADHRSPNEQRTRDRAALANRVLEELSELPERQQGILRQYFGLEGSRAPASYTQIGERIGLSKERVRQLALEALDTLRGRLECGLPEDEAYTVVRPFDRDSISRLLQSGKHLKHASL